MSLGSRVAPQAGRVARFDGATGWGVIAAENGIDYPFHCTAIADGTRTIEADIPVSFSLTPGHRGVWEATGLTPR